MYKLADISAFESLGNPNSVSNAFVFNGEFTLGGYALARELIKANKQSQQALKAFADMFARGYSREFSGADLSLHTPSDTDQFLNSWIAKEIGAVYDDLEEFTLLDLLDIPKDKRAFITWIYKYTCEAINKSDTEGNTNSIPDKDVVIGEYGVKHVAPKEDKDSSIAERKWEASGSPINDYGVLD